MSRTSRNARRCDSSSLSAWTIQDVALHREIEQLLPPDIVTSDLAGTIRTENRDGEGDASRAIACASGKEIVTLALEVELRTLDFSKRLREGITDLLAIVEDENVVHTPARVNGDHPAGRSIPAIPPCILAALPTLPSEVRYSFVGRDLILWDLHAGLIVDFVPRAVPISTTD